MQIDKLKKQIVVSKLQREIDESNNIPKVNKWSKKKDKDRFPKHSTTTHEGKLLIMKDQSYGPKFEIKVRVMKQSHVIKSQIRRNSKLTHESVALDFNEDPSII